MSIIYRKLKPEDSKEYWKIRLECLERHPDNFGTGFEEEKLNPKLDFESYIRQNTLGKFIYGAFDEGILIGICVFSQESRRKTRHIGNINQMYVKAEYQGKGVGIELLNTVVKQAFMIPEIEQLVLSVVASNKGANILYEKAGFIQYGLQKNYFKDESRYFDQRFMIKYRK